MNAETGSETRRETETIRETETVRSDPPAVEPTLQAGPVDERAAASVRQDERAAEAPEGDGPPAGGGFRARLGGGAWRWAALLALVALAGFFLRARGLDWDEGQHLHPDERFLTMVGSALGRPQDLLHYMDTDTSPLNPRNMGHSFYVYGTWPMSVARVVAEWAEATDFHNIYMVGRQLSVLYDLLALILLFGVGARLYDKRVGLLAALFTAFCAFHIQQAHFFTADGPANFYVVLFLFFAAGILRRERWIQTALAGVAMGLALASKISVWPLSPVIVIALAAEAWRRGGSQRQWWIWAAKVAVIGLVSFTTLRLAQPDMFAGPGWPNVVENPGRYAEVTASAPDWWFGLEARMPEAAKPMLLPDPRWAENLHRASSQIQGYGMDWPPNHQWWQRTDWWFPWRNMVQFGMGIPLGLLAWGGWLLAGWQLIRRRRTIHTLPWLWTGWMFFYYGMQWSRTMRYFLPIYPTLILLGAWLLVVWWDRARGEDRRAGGMFAPSGRLTLDLPDWTGRLLRPAWPAVLGSLVILGTLLYGFAFSNIYGRQHSRNAASRWIYHNVPTAFGLVAAEPYAERDWGQLKLLPARPPNELRFEPQSYRYELEPGRWYGPAEVRVPGGEPVTIEAAQLAHLADAMPGTGPVTIEAVVSQSSALGPDGQPESVDSRGEARIDLSDAGQLARVDLEPLILQPGSLPVEPPRGMMRKLRQILGMPWQAPETEPAPSYSLWLRVEGGAVSGRTSILADHTTWDDTVPRGLDGYGPWDQADTEWAEGLYGFVQLDLYGEDRDLSKLERTLDGLARSDFTIATSNRVYGSVAQLPTRYPATIRLYELMFDQRLGFDLAMRTNRFAQLGPLQLPDQAADEAFHVYDHPQVDLWRVDAVDLEALRAELEPLAGPEAVTWEWPSDTRSLADRYVWPLLSLLPGIERPDPAARPEAVSGADGFGAAELPPDPAELLLDAERRQAERERADYLFDPEGWSARWPWLAALVWYLVLGLVGLAAFPLVWSLLPNLADRGWSIARTAGLLITGYLAWLLASLRLVDHKPLLLWACLAVLAAASAWCLRGGAARRLRDWIVEHRRTLLWQEGLFLAIFLIFLGIRWGNPDLWHPFYGGEKPMDFAYLNATLRSVSFPPFDPWFAGGKLNYYYYGFVFIGSLMEMTRILPWVAYNLAIPSLAAMTGLGVAGLVHAWLRASGVLPRIAAGAGLLGAVLAVLAGNLYQPRMIAENLAAVSGSSFESQIPGLATLVRALSVLPRWLGGEIQLGLRTSDWYWGASRAIPAQGEVIPITEMPFFTFVYADLHAHMMALPITVLALAVALSWVIGSRGDRLGYWWLEPWRLGRLLLAALAIGALWPANTWDFPTYGLVAAGALAAGEWRRLGKPGLRWVIHVGLRGGPLLALSLLLFKPYHDAYLTPYADFQLWRGAKTPPDAYLIVHGIFLFAILSWVLARLDDLLADPAERRGLLLRLGLGGLVAAGSLWWLWGETTAGFGPGSEFPPSPWTPFIGGMILVLGLALLLAPRLSATERFAAWLLVLGAFLTLFVEFVVLAGDIGRMNTVFKFYIQVWVLWAALAAFAAGSLAQRWARMPAMGGAGAVAWRAVFGLLVAAGLVYTVTAARAKIVDRFHPAHGMPEDERAALEDAYAPGLSGVDFFDYAYYAETDTEGESNAMALRHDWPAIRWLLENVEGSPTILEAYNYQGGYRWSSRFSIYTGLPTVIGWDWHQKQQRNAVGGWVVDERTRDVGEIYNSLEPEQARALLEHYQVEYLIVGELERVLYQAEGLAKFERWAEEGQIETVYASEVLAEDGRPLVRIYRLDWEEGEAALP